MKWVIHIIQGILAAGFLMSGMSKLFMKAEEIRTAYTDTMGYSTGFMYTVAAVETLMMLGLIIGFWRHRVALGASIVLIVIMIGAIWSTLAAGSGADVILPAVYLVLLVALAFARRGEWRIMRTAAAQSK